MTPEELQELIDNPESQGPTTLCNLLDHINQQAAQIESLKDKLVLERAHQISLTTLEVCFIDLSPEVALDCIKLASGELVEEMKDSGVDWDD